MKALIHEPGPAMVEISVQTEVGVGSRFNFWYNILERTRKLTSNDLKWHESANEITLS